MTATITGNSVPLPARPARAAGTRPSAPAQAQPALAVARPEAADPLSRVGFFLFILVNAALFLRPAELFPSVWTPSYENLIVACLIVSARSVLRQLDVRTIKARPVTACVLGLFVAVVLSHLAHFQVGFAISAGVKFAKLLAYYLLLVGLVDSRRRLRVFLVWLAVFVSVVATLSLLHYHGKVDIPALEPYAETQGYDADGESIVVVRLRAVGIFNDPNDFCLVLLMAAGVCVYSFVESRRRLLRFAWVVPLAVCGFAFSLTHSRGGFLALLAGLTVFFNARFGWRKTIALSLVTLPVMFLLFAGRQTNITTEGGTGQGRIQVWAAGLGLLRGAPLFGIGADQFGETVGPVAHNSYVHSYVELGFFGGTLFFGAFFFAHRALAWVRQCVRGLPGEVARMSAYLSAILAAYATLIFTLSRVYVAPTYLVVGLAASYATVAERELGIPRPRLDGKALRHLVGYSACCLIGIYLFVRLTVRWSS